MIAENRKRLNVSQSYQYSALKIASAAAGDSEQPQITRNEFIRSTKEEKAEEIISRLLRRLMRRVRQKRRSLCYNYKELAEIKSRSNRISYLKKRCEDLQERKKQFESTLTELNCAYFREGLSV
jgi:predicted component of type VI protein secretion system